MKRFIILVFEDRLKVFLSSNMQNSERYMVIFSCFRETLIAITRMPVGDFLPSEKKLSLGFHVMCESK